jgi:hypothetical protein
VAASSAPDTHALADIERWFIARGVPHFVADHSPTRVVLRRAAPLLVAYLVVSLLLAANLSWSLELNLLSVVAAGGVVLVAWIAVNVLRGRRWLSLPDKVGVPEVGAFLLIPAIPPLLIGMQVSDAIIAVVESAIFLALVYVATSYAVLGSLGWALRRAGAQVSSLGRLLTRALPLLMVFIAFTFLSSDVWAVSAALSWQAVVTVVLFFLGLSIAFLVGRLAPVGRRLVSTDESWERTLAAVDGTPAQPLRGAVAGSPPPRVPLRWHEWVNVGTLIVLGQGVQIVLVTLAVQAALVVFGLLLVPAAVQEQWIGRPVHSLFSASLGTETITITTELLVVALILGAFSGLYFTVSALSDATYRAEFFSDADRELTQVLAVRSVYYAARELTPAVASSTPSPRPS